MGKAARLQTAPTNGEDGAAPTSEDAEAMNVLADFAKRLAAVEAKVNNIAQEAVVVAVHPDENLLDIEVGGVVLEKVPFQTGRAAAIAKTYWLPEVGESGLLVCPGGNPGNALFMPAVNTAENPAPASDANQILIEAEGQGLKIDLGDGTELVISQEATELLRTEGTIKIKETATETERATGEIKDQVGVNAAILSAIGLNLLGAIFYNTGITTLQSPVGPVMFAPSPSPAVAPSAPSGSSPNSDGEATKTPPSQIANVGASGTITAAFTIPPLPVTVGALAGFTASTPVTLSLNLSNGTLTLQFPARDL